MSRDAVAAAIGLLLEPLPLLLALNQRCAAAEKEGSAIAGPGLPGFCKGDERFFSHDCLSTEEPGHKFTAEMEYVGHIDLTEDDILDLEEQREAAAAIDREIHGDDA